MTATQELARYPSLMSPPEDQVQQPRWAMRLGSSLRSVKRGTVRVLGASVPAALRHVRDHAYAMAGLGCGSAAGYVHSVFAGLIVTCAAFLILEFKIQMEGDE